MGEGQDVARVEPVVRPDLIDPVTDSWVNTIAEVAKLASFIATTEFVPENLRGRGGAPAAAAMLYGREIGLPPMQSLASVHVVKGKPGLYAETMRAMVLQAGHDLEIVEMGSARCTLRGRRRGSETWSTVSWTMGDAHTAKLVGENWSKYPRAMLLARCTTELCRAVFPDVIKGMRSVEESDDSYEPNPVSRNGVGAAAQPTPKVSRAAARQQQVSVPAAPVDAPPLPGDVPAPQTSQTSAPPAEAEAPEPPVSSGSPPDPQADAHGQDGTGASVLAPDVQEAAEDAAAAERGQMTRAQTRKIMAQLKDLQDPMGRDTRLNLVGGILGRTLISMATLTHADASAVIDTLGRILASADPAGGMRWVLERQARQVPDVPAAAGDPDLPQLDDAPDGEVTVEDPPDLPY